MGLPSRTVLRVEMGPPCMPKPSQPAAMPPADDANMKLQGMWAARNGAEDWVGSAGTILAHMVTLLHGLLPPHAQPTHFPSPPMNNGFITGTNGRIQRKVDSHIMLLSRACALRAAGACAQAMADQSPEG